MTHKLLTIAVASLCLVACSETDDMLSAYRNDPKAVHVTAQVGQLSTDGFTRSNPLATTEEAQKKFNADDEISVSADGQDAVTYRYNGEEWLPQGGKFLKWETTEMTFRAYYPATYHGGSITQPTAYDTPAALEAADFMSFSGSQTNAGGNRLSLTMERQMARVVVEIVGYNDQYSEETTTVNSVTVMGAKAYFHSDKKYYALMVPCPKSDNGQFLSINVTEGGTTATETLTGIPALDAGKSYLYKLTVGKDRILIAGVTVADWITGEVLSGKTQLAISVNGNVITMYKAGSLTEQVLTEALGTGHALKIAGPMNDDDFATLRTYLKGLNIDQNGTPIDIDLAEAEVKTIPNILHGSAIGFNTLGKVALPKSVETINPSAFQLCKKLDITNWEQLTKLQYIYSNAFDGCSVLTGNVVLPGQLSLVGYRAFAFTKIKSISFPDGAELRGIVCYGCENLEKITFQGNVTFNESSGTNGVYAQFRDCTALTTIDFSNCTTVPDISAANGTDKDAFHGVTRSGVTLYVPAGMKQDFIDKGWTGFTIVEQ